MSKFRPGYPIVLAILLCLLLTGGQYLRAAEEEYDGVSSLDFKLDSDYEGEAATYRFRYKDIGTDEEAIRVDMTESTGDTLIIIMDRGERSVYVKDVGGESWETFPGMIMDQMWDTWREPYLTLPDRGSTTWQDLEGGEYEYNSVDGTVKIYDISVDEPIDDSLFLPG